MGCKNTSHRRLASCDLANLASVYLGPCLPLSLSLFFLSLVCLTNRASSDAWPSIANLLRQVNNELHVPIVLPILCLFALVRSIRPIFPFVSCDYFIGDQKLHSTREMEKDAIFQHSRLDARDNNQYYVSFCGRSHVFLCLALQAHDVSSLQGKRIGSRPSKQLLRCSQKNPVDEPF